MNDINFLESLYLPYNDVKNGENTPDFSATIDKEADITFNNWTHNREETLSFINAFCKKMRSICVELLEVTCINPHKRIYVVLSNWILEPMAMHGIKEKCRMMEVIYLKNDKIIKAVGAMHTGSMGEIFSEIPH